MTRVRVGELIISDEAGFACNKNKLVQNGLPHLRPFNISDSGTLDLTQVYQIPPTEAPSGKTQLLAGDILFNNTNSAELVGKSVIINAPITAGFSNHLTRIRVDRNRVNPSWLSFWLRHMRSTGYFTLNATQWVSQAAYRTSDLRILELSLPSLDEQRGIVDILSRAEGIVRLRRDAQQKARAIIPALFLDMFGDASINPKGWRIAPLSDVAKVQGGLQVTTARAKLPLETSYLRVANVYRSRLDLKEIKSIRLTEAEFNRTRLEFGDLLFVEGHGNPQEVGRVAMWDGSIPLCTHQNHLIRARLQSEIILPIYACWLLNSMSGRQSLSRAGKTTSGLSTISTKNVKDAKMMLPPIAIQTRFVDRCCAVSSIVAQQANALTKAEATFQSLLSHAFGVDLAAIRSAEEVAVA